MFSAPRQSVLSDPRGALSLLSLAGKAVVVVLLVGWLVWFAPFDDLVDRNGTPLGGDFVMFYVAGQVVLDGETESLYDDHANQQRSAVLFPSMRSTESWPYRYPPLTAGLMSVLARLPFAVAFAAFFAISLAAVVVAIRVLMREFGWDQVKVSTEIFWSMAGWSLVGEALLGGQSSPIALCLVACSAVALRRNRDFFGGALLGLCIYKPNIVALLVIGTLVARPRAFWGMLCVAVPAVLLSIQTAGVQGLQTYVELASSLATSEWSLETPFWKVHGLAPLLDLVVPGRGKPFAFLLGIPIAVWFGLQWRNAEDHRWWMAFGGLLTTNALFNPYVPIYDMLLLLPAIAIIALCPDAGSKEKLDIRILAIAGFFFLPHISQALAKTLGVQLFPLAVLGFLWMIRNAIASKPNALWPWWSQANPR